MLRPNTNDLGTALPRTQQRCGGAGCGKTTRRANHFRFAEIVSSPKIKNISLFQKSEQWYIYRHPVPLRGASAVVTNEGRVAVDAEVPMTNGTEAYGEDVWS